MAFRTAKEKHHHFVWEKEGNRRRPGAIICKGDVAECDAVEEIHLQLHCSAEPHIRPILMGYLGFKS